MPSRTEDRRRGPKILKRPDGFYIEKKAGEVVRMTNYTARIVEEITYDDGAGPAGRAYVVSVKVGRGAEERYIVASGEFHSMAWVADRIGARAILYNTKGASLPKIRLAIQENSPHIRKVTVYRAIGWQRIRGQWVYLHAGGALGAHGPVSGLRVEPPAGLENYRLPDPRGADLREAVQASLDFTRIAPDAVTMPAYALMVRAPVGSTDVAVHFGGRSGSRKTQLAALLQAHSGAAFDEDTLPASFMDTPLSIPEMASMVRDAVFVVDDFVPLASGKTGKEMQHAAERLFRSVGNQAGRARLRGGTRVAGAPPRCMVVTTGEDVPEGYSLRGRLTFVRVADGAVSLPALSAAQQAARGGKYATAMAGFVQWLASRRQQIANSLPDRLAELRRDYQRYRPHPRTPDNLAQAVIGLDIWAEFAEDVGAVTGSEADQLRQRLSAVLPEVADMQQSILSASDPAGRLVPLLRAAIRSGNAHVGAMGGGLPADPGRLGWTPVEGATRPQGRRIGWVEGDELYLDFTMALAAAQESAEAAGEPLTITPTKLKKRLQEQGYLRSVDRQRETLTIRKMIDGKRVEVLHVSARPLLET